MGKEHKKVNATAEATVEPVPNPAEPVTTLVELVMVIPSEDIVIEHINPYEASDDMDLY